MLTISPNWLPPNIKAHVHLTCAGASKGHATPFQFAMLADAGIKVGSELEFIYGRHKVKVADLKNKIEFEGELLTDLRAKLGW